MVQQLRHSCIQKEGSSLYLLFNFSFSQRDRGLRELIVRVNIVLLLWILGDFYKTFSTAVTILVQPQSPTTPIDELPRVSSMPCHHLSRG